MKVELTQIVDIKTPTHCVSYENVSNVLALFYSYVAAEEYVEWRSKATGSPIGSYSIKRVME